MLNKFIKNLILGILVVAGISLVGCGSTEEIEEEYERFESIERKQGLEDSKKYNEEMQTDEVYFDTVFRYLEERKEDDTREEFYNVEYYFDGFTDSTNEELYQELLNEYNTRMEEYGTTNSEEIEVMEAHKIQDPDQYMLNYLNMKFSVNASAFKLEYDGDTLSDRLVKGKVKSLVSGKYVYDITLDVYTGEIDLIDYK